jgi:Tol biopolymer transport system component
MTSDGTNVRALAESLDVAGAVSWSPDGKSIAVSGDDGKGPRLFKVSTSGEAVVLRDGPAVTPEWSPDGKLIVYTEPIQAAEYPLRAVTADGRPVPMPDIWTRGDGYGHRFLPDGKKLVILQGGYRNWDFWLYDFSLNRVRRLTKLKQGFSNKSFDISPDGKRILFDRIRENSDVVLIDLAK